MLAVAAVPGVLAPAPATAAVAAAPRAGVTVEDFYRSRGNAPLWFTATSGDAAQELVQLLASASADKLSPKHYDPRGLARAVRDASRGDPGSVRKADMMLSRALVAYARDLQHDPHVGVIYVDPELRPAPQSPAALLAHAAQAPSLADYVAKMGWMNPVYAPLRQAIATRMYRNDRERQLLSINLERARALPGGYARFVLVNPVAQRLYMYENGEVVDQMRGLPASRTRSRRRR